MFKNETLIVFDTNELMEGEFVGHAKISYAGLTRIRRIYKLDNERLAYIINTNKKEKSFKLYYGDYYDIPDMLLEINECPYNSGIDCNEDLKYCIGCGWRAQYQNEQESKKTNNID